MALASLMAVATSPAFAFNLNDAVNAASTLLILLTAGLTALALWLQGADIAKQAA